MEQLSFLVQGSSDTPYQVTFHRQGGSISAKCSCPAGLNRQLCKHRMSILSGSNQSVVSGNPQDISTVVSWLPGSNIERAWMDVQRLENDLNRVKVNLAAAKKRLCKSMHEFP
jgi:hypothetical protein